MAINYSSKPSHKGSHKSWQHQLYVIIFEANTPAGKLFDVILLWAILISTLCVILESDAHFKDSYGIYLKSLEWFFTIIFTIEYGLRILCARKSLAYIKSFFGIVDLISIVPTYLSLIFPGAQMLVVTRFIRLLRVFRILKLVRYSQESRFLIQALMNSRYKITVFLGAVFTCVVILGTLMYLVEEGTPGFSSILGGMYWSVVTMTTVGYGDVVPSTGLGKFLAVVIMIIGYGVIAVPTGIVSAEMSHSMIRRSSPTSVPPNSSLFCPCGAQFYPPEARFCHQCGSPRPPEEAKPQGP